jgi:hypothetical protein
MCKSKHKQEIRNDLDTVLNVLEARNKNVQTLAQVRDCLVRIQKCSLRRRLRKAVLKVASDLSTCFLPVGTAKGTLVENIEIYTYCMRNASIVMSSADPFRHEALQVMGYLDTPGCIF